MNIKEITTIIEKIETGKLSPTCEEAVEAHASLHTAGWNTWVLEEVSDLKRRFRALNE